ncbi:hypothetical protein P8452_47856 [Trifolium repens]|nr:hypothetical protein P8452_47856 [Trifolium repens]
MSDLIVIFQREEVLVVSCSYTGIDYQEAIAFLELCQKTILIIHTLVLYIETKLIEASAENADSEKDVI